MMSLVLLWSAICRIAQQTMHAWRVVVVGMMLCLTMVAGCDVRPFSELFGDESAEETDTGDDEVDTPTEPLELTPNPATIETPENTPRTIEVTIDNREPGRTYTFAITTRPANGTAEINNDGRLTFTPNPDFSGTDSLVVTVTDNGTPVRSGDTRIPITVTPG